MLPKEVICRELKPPLGSRLPKLCSRLLLANSKEEVNC
ncbi:unnamed protein product [Cylicostephanus goldi]|uniref:Uncharacterized protein n=1 Tax=Cylicostephanus goldi TaxID=71465 RepID=A0A3P7RC96_CYLGO|nr:unnamed protein product [Cylicostephanus goldi]